MPLPTARPSRPSVIRAGLLMRLMLAASLLLVVLAACAPLGNDVASIGATGHGATATNPAPTATATIASPTATAQPLIVPSLPPLNLPGWVLVWHDEFDGPSLDSSHWNVVSDGPDGYHNCCLNSTTGAWAPDDVSIVHGSLRLTTERRWYQGKPYTTGAVTTQGKFAFLYGRIDFRGRVPKGDGLWPAFWLLPEEMPGASAQYEVDVMEALGQDTHTDYMVGWAPGWHNYCQYTGPDFSADYHVYSFVWTPTSSTWLIDGVARCTFTKGMPTVPMYVILNNHIGGDWPVPPNATTHLPQYTDIDYVRVYAAASSQPPQPHD